MEKPGYVYILASRMNGTLYIGVTSDLQKRIWQHKNDVMDGFSKDHKVHNLVYYEIFNDISDAIVREKDLKGWNRAWKIKLIERFNPEWLDMYDQL